jgi:hypothetical protein
MCSVAGAIAGLPSHPCRQAIPNICTWLRSIAAIGGLNASNPATIAYSRSGKSCLFCLAIRKA